MSTPLVSVSMFSKIVKNYKFAALFSYLVFRLDPNAVYIVCGLIFKRFEDYLGFNP